MSEGADGVKYCNKKAVVAKARADAVRAQTRGKMQVKPQREESKGQCSNIDKHDYTDAKLR